MIYLLLNIAFGLVTPWVLGLWLLKRDKKIVLIIMPFTSMVSYTVNLLGFTFNFWLLKPFELYAFSALPFDLGLFPLLGCALIYIIKNKKINQYFLIFTFALLTTGLEFAGLFIGYVIYRNGWNIFYTYISYLIPFAIVYWYYVNLKRYSIL